LRRTDQEESPERGSTGLHGRPFSWGNSVRDGNRCLGADHHAELDLTEGDVRAKAWWADPQGLRGGERAVAAALVAARAGWSSFGRALDGPLLQRLAKPAYELIAGYGYKLPGATPACRL